MKQNVIIASLSMALLASCAGNEADMRAYTLDKADVTVPRINPLVLMANIRVDTLAELIKDDMLGKIPEVKKVLNKLINNPKMLEVYTPPVFAPGDTTYYSLMHYNSPTSNALTLADVHDTTGMKIPLFDPVADASFSDFAYTTGGEAYHANNPQDVALRIMEILNKHTTDGTDIFFLIDKTGSMGDDIENIKHSLTDIIKILKKFKDIRVGWGAYGDKNCDGAQWYVYGDLDTELDKALDGIKTIKVYGGGDYPESVNDGIVKSVDGLSWRKESNKMMLVLGDAPSLLPPRSKYSQADVIAKCKSAEIELNVYPIIIGMYNFYPEAPAMPYVPDTTMGDGLKKYTRDDRPIKFTDNNMVVAAGRDEVIDKFYPNPVRDYCNVVFTGEGNYLVELKSLYGDLISSQEIAGSRCKVDFTGVAAGMYVIVVTDIAHRKQRFAQVVKN